MKQLLRYVNPQDDLPDFKGCGDLLVIGSAIGVWDDLKKYDHLHGNQDRMAVNDMMSYYPHPLTHGATLTLDKVPMWTFSQRLQSRRNKWAPMLVHTHRYTQYSDLVWHFMRDGGTSGLFAAIIGILMGYDNIILAGIPCDDSPRFFDPPWKKHDMFGQPHAHIEWERVIKDVPVFSERVRSLSGNTAAWLGRPGLVAKPRFIVNKTRQKRTVVVEVSESRRQEKVTVITPTGDRPEALSLLGRWMDSQTYPPDQWIIVDDGQVPVNPEEYPGAQVIRREPEQNKCTLGDNLLAAVPAIEHDKILIMEDDDWYGPGYVQFMAEQLNYHDLVGIWGTKYYDLRIPGYRDMGRNDHASLSQTAFHRDFLPYFEQFIPGDCSVDLRLWFRKNHAGDNIKSPRGFLIPGEDKQLHCSIKGMPGRAGAGCGHDRRYYTCDSDLTKLHEWCTEVEAYRTYLEEDSRKSIRKQNRLVVYTAISGPGRDQLKEVKKVPGVDYVCFTDQDFSSETWELRPFTWTHGETVRTAKHPKVMPHRYFPDHDMSVWVDGNILPKMNIYELAKRYLSQYSLIAHRHPGRTCIYDEAKWVMEHQQDHADLVKETIDRYKMLNVPRNIGLCECGVLFRRHHKPAVKEAMERWWHEVCRGTSSDQITFSYVLWELSLELLILDGNVRESEDFEFTPHNTLFWGKTLCS